MPANIVCISSYWDVDASGTMYSVVGTPEHTADMLGMAGAIMTTIGTTAQFLSAVGKIVSGLDAINLRLKAKRGVSDMNTLDLQINALNNEASEAYSSGSWNFYLNNIDNPIGKYSSIYKQYGGGVRFPYVNVPKGATITAAYLTLTSDASRTGSTVNSKITGDAEDNAAVFSTQTDYQNRRGTIIGGVNNTKITSNQVLWDNIASWVTDTAYQYRIYQLSFKRFNRSGWNPNQAMAFWVDDYDDLSVVSSENCRRTYYCYNKFDH